MACRTSSNVSAVDASAPCVPVFATPRSSSTTRRSQCAWTVGRTVVGNGDGEGTLARRRRANDPLATSARSRLGRSTFNIHPSGGPVQAPVDGAGWSLEIKWFGNASPHSSGARLFAAFSSPGQARISERQWRVEPAINVSLPVSTTMGALQTRGGPTLRAPLLRRRGPRTSRNRLGQEDRVARVAQRLGNRDHREQSDHASALARDHPHDAGVNSIALLRSTGTRSRFAITSPTGTARSPETTCQALRIACRRPPSAAVTPRGGRCERRAKGAKRRADADPADRPCRVRARARRRARARSAT
jgi:hypothetical protein